MVSSALRTRWLVSVHVAVGPGEMDEGSTLQATVYPDLDTNGMSKEDAMALAAWHMARAWPEAQLLGVSAEPQTVPEG